MEINLTKIKQNLSSVEIKHYETKLFSIYFFSIMKNKKNKLINNFSFLGFFFYQGSEKFEITQKYKKSK